MKAMIVQYTCDICKQLITDVQPQNGGKIEIIEGDDYTSVTIRRVSNHIGAEHICSTCMGEILQQALPILGR